MILRVHSGFALEWKPDGNCSISIMRFWNVILCNWNPDRSMSASAIWRHLKSAPGAYRACRQRSWNRACRD